MEQDGKDSLAKLKKKTLHNTLSKLFGPKTVKTGAKIPCPLLTQLIAMTAGCFLLNATKVFLPSSPSTSASTLA